MHLLAPACCLTACVSGCPVCSFKGMCRVHPGELSLTRIIDYFSGGSHRMLPRRQYSSLPEPEEQYTSIGDGSLVSTFPLFTHYTTPCVEAVRSRSVADRDATPAITAQPATAQHGSPVTGGGHARVLFVGREASYSSVPSRLPAIISGGATSLRSTSVVWNV